MTTKTKNKEQNVTLLDMIQEPMVVEIETPEELKAKLPHNTWVKVIDAEDSMDFTATQLEYFNQADENGNIKTKSPKEQLELVAKLSACLIVDWDEAYFGKFSEENLMKVLTTPRFAFVGNAVQEHRAKRQDFFNKA